MTIHKFSIFSQKKDVPLGTSSVCKKQHFDSCASCGSTHKIEFAEQIHKFRGAHLGIYTGEEKMCLQGAFFLQNSIESVISIERLLGKR